MASFFVYVLYSSTSGKTYAGFTSDLKSRMDSHNVFAKKGYTIRYRPWVLIYTEEFPNKRDALLREKELKTGKGRAFIKEIIRRQIDAGFISA